MSIADALNVKALQIGRLAVQMTGECGSGHPSTALSLAHITSVLMYRVMRWDPKNPWDGRADRIVLSEGHAVPIVYAACIDLGVMIGRDPKTARELQPQDVHDLRAADSMLDGHPNPHLGFPLFDTATGSLGQGLSAGAGLAMAAQRCGTHRRVFVVCGDGEMREGQVAEAMDFVADHNPTNLVAIVNCNGMGQADHVSRQQSADTLVKKFRAAGWAVRDVDGHDVVALEKALGRIPRKKPLAVICRTVKGWGVASLQNVGSHGKALSADDTRAAIDELRLPEAMPEELATLTPPRPRGHKITGAENLALLDPPDFSAVAKGGKLATRKAYGIGLRELGRKNEHVVVLDADVSNSTFSEYFGKEFPERFVECKIGEQNMVSVAAGLAAGGLLPFGNSFGKFLVRAYDQVEMSAISGVNMKLAGSHSGVTLAADGPSQMALVDVPFFRAMSHARLCDGQPMAIMLLPADATCAYRCVEMAAQHRGLVYIRTLRPDMPILYGPDETFSLGGAKVLRDGDDVTLVGSCYTTHMALAAAETLAGEGVSCRVIDCYSLPLKDEQVLALARDPSQRMLVIDDSYVGGFGSELAEVAAAWQGARVWSMTVTVAPKSAREPEEVLAQVGLGADAVLARARKLSGGEE